MSKDLDESKQDKFKRVATKRTQKILKTIRLLGNCANQSVYEYSKKDVDKIFKAISEELQKSKNLFKEASDEEFQL